MRRAGLALHLRVAAAEQFVSYYGVPLIARGQVKGVLEIFHRLPLYPDGEWLDFQETLAGQAAIAIDNLQMLENLQRANTDLGLAYDGDGDGKGDAGRGDRGVTEGAAEEFRSRVREAAVALSLSAWGGKEDPAGSSFLATIRLWPEP